MKIAVIDSGVHVRHPHIFAKTTGATFGAEDILELSQDSALWSDELGHGTAVMAAIQEKAPEAEYYAIKLFSKSLSTTSARLVRALEWAIDSRMDLINLSLGTYNLDFLPTFESLVSRANERQSILICARSEGEKPVLPGILPGVLSVDVDWQLTRSSYHVIRSGETCHYMASGFPRPLPGISPARNLSGISFAVANMTGLVARACERMQERSLRAIEETLTAEALRILK